MPRPGAVPPNSGRVEPPTPGPPIPGEVVLGGIPPGVAPLPVDGFAAGLDGLGVWAITVVPKAAASAKTTALNRRRCIA
jgi:hypothetical protein